MLQSIDAVIERLDAIIDEATSAGSTMGYFPALYRRVTLVVKEAIEERQFDDNARMEALDIHFAQRYLDAYDQLQASEQLTDSWRMAFDQAGNSSLIVLQHLLLGMNAHISLDLGISAAAIADPADPLSLKNDFEAINAILGSMINDTQNRLTRIFGPLGMVDSLLGPIDESLSLFSIEYARDKAWTQTLELITGGAQRRETLIQARDARVAAFSAQLIRPPRFYLRVLLHLIRMLERQDVPGRIRILKAVDTS